MRISMAGRLVAAGLAAVASGGAVVAPRDSVFHDFPPPRDNRRKHATSRRKRRENYLADELRWRMRNDEIPRGYSGAKLARKALQAKASIARIQ